MIVLFVLCVLVPILAFGALIFDQMVGYLENQARGRLRQESEIAAGVICGRLEVLNGALGLALEELRSEESVLSGDLPQSLRHLDGRVDGISIVPRAGRIVTVFGKTVRVSLADRTAWAYLETGRTLLHTVGDQPGESRLVLGRLFDSSNGETRVLWAEVNSDFLWGLGGRSMLPPGMELCVLDQYGELLIRTPNITLEFASRLQWIDRRRMEETFSWTGPNGRFLSGRSLVRMSDELGGVEWTIVVSEAESLIREPVAKFKRLFPLVMALVLLCVLLAGTIQIRRVLGPLEEIRAGMRRMAEQDFDVGVTVNSGDEFEEVADGFNLMAVKLGRQFRELNTLAQVSRAALSGGSMTEIVGPVLASLPEVVPCKRAELRLNDEFAWDEGNMIVAAPDRGDESSVPRLSIVDPEGGLQPDEDAQPLTCELGFGELRIGELRLFPVDDFEFQDDQRDDVRAMLEHLSLALYQVGLRARLSRERERLSTLIEHLPSGVVLVDGDGKVVISNQSVAPYLRLLCEEDGGVETVRALAGQRLENLAERCKAGLFVRLDIDEPEQRSFVVGVGRLGGDEAHVGFVVVIRDATRQQQIEQRLKQQDRLAAVGRLAAGIAHDFNNILQGIMMSAELMYVEGESDASEESAALSIFRQGERGARLIRQILDFGRRSESDLQAIDMVETCRDSMRFLRQALPPELHVELDLPDGPVMIVADQDRVQQLLTNLILNARDAIAGKGQIRVKLATWREGLGEDGQGTAPSAWARLVVSDTGPGIPDDETEVVFEPFYTTKGPKEGTGLGLAQVYGIVSQHGGRIDLTRSDLGGAEFVIEMPLSETDKESTPVRVLDAPPTGNGELILVVQEDQGLLELTCSGLERSGYLYLTAREGKQALRLLEKDGADVAVALTDFVLQDMTGLELAREIQASYESLPVVMMSGYPVGASQTSENHRSDQIWLQKPFTVNELARAVHEALRSTEAAEQGGGNREDAKNAKRDRCLES
jgi:signal transduction histidine kinase/FixJ family two-component response regulator